jgi:hypothetical protein
MNPIPISFIQRIIQFYDAADSRQHQGNGHLSIGIDATVVQRVAQSADHRHRRLLRMRGEQLSSSRTAEQRDELATFQLIELHFGPLLARAGLQDIELAGISQQISGRLHTQRPFRYIRRCATSAPV